MPPADRADRYLAGGISVVIRRMRQLKRQEKDFKRFNPYGLRLVRIHVRRERKGKCQKRENRKRTSSRFRWRSSKKLRRKKFQTTKRKETTSRLQRSARYL